MGVVATRVLSLGALLAVACDAPDPDVVVARRAVTATPAYVQAAYTNPQIPLATVPLAYPAAQLAGDLNVVVVGWNDATAQVTSVSDSKGNAYALAVGPTVLPGTLSQSIYYAKAIAPAAAGANTVTVTFNVPAQYVDLRVAEYSGLDTTAPLDVTAVGASNGTTATTGTATTTGATALLVAGTTVTSWNSGAGAGYTLRFVTMPDSDLLEDRVVAVAGANVATAPLGSAGGWVIQVAAFRAAVTGGDVTPPAAPKALGATAGGGQINLTWTPATDDVGVTGYRVERCQGPGCTSFAPLGTSTGTTFADTGLAISTAYSYRVRAVDAAGNLSAYSNVASATTPAPDGTAPSAPGTLTATPATGTQINVSWGAATDNVGVTAYLVERCTGVGCATFAQVTSQAATTLADPALVPGTSYSYRVRATDAAGNVGAYSNTASATTSATVANPAFVQANYADPQTPQASVQVTFAAAQTAGNLDVIAVGWNDVTAQVTGVTDSKGNVYTRAVGPTAGQGMTQSMYYAKNIAGAAAGANTVTVTFNVAARYPDVRIAEYANVDRTNPVDVANGATGTGTLASTSVVTTFPVTMLVAADMVTTTTTGPGAGYITRLITSPDSDLLQDWLVTSAKSWNATANLTTGGWVIQVVAFKGLSGGGDTQAPAAPGALTAQGVSTSQIDLTWGVATDNVGVTSYLVERCQGVGCTAFAQVGTVGGTAFSSTGLVPGASYSFRVRAADAAGNLSVSSNTASATTSAVVVAPSYVQGNAADPQTPLSSVQVTFTGPQAAGDVNVIAVGWNNTTSQVASVTDLKGNVYVLAVGPTSYPGVLSQSMYYAKNIAAAAAGTNKVTVTFNAPTAFPDIRIAEYAGINGANPVDVTAVGTGTATAAATAAVTTTNPSDLLVAANMVATYTTAAGAGFTLRVRSNTDGDILEDRVVSSIGSYAGTSTLNSAGGWVMQLVAFRAAGSMAPSADATPPVVTITAPAGGATISGTTVVSVSATDASAIGSVQLLVDGSAFGLPDTASPYQFSVDTTALANGAHTIGATATDVAANTGAAPPVSVTSSNQAGQNGAWSALLSLPIVAVHSALLPDGTILMSDAQTTFGADARVWDPSTNATTKKTAPSNLFCSASEQMKDGRILVVGGHQGAHYGLTDTNLFNPATGSWSPAAQMAYPRWYPTVMALADGRFLVVGGESNCNFCNVTQAEVYDPTANRWSPIGSPFELPYYPHTFVLPNGRVFVSSTTREPIASQVFDVGGSSWTTVGGPVVDGGSAVMYLPGKVLKTGTSVDPDQVVRSAAATSYVIDMNQISPAPAWRQVASMSFARTFHALTVLPDGTVLATGGGPTTAATDTANGVLRAELWSPTTETWSLLPPMAAARLYHSEALLLRDGRVAVMGGGRFDDVTVPTDQFSAQIFSPPYLFKGARPAITSAPAVLSYGQPFSVQTPDAARIASVSLVRFGATTHSFNAGQRFVPLTFTAGSGALTVTAPTSANLAPGGNYMLFIVDSTGVPSVAAIVHF